jgi:transcriptional regulator with XRE-family HTH domain
MFRESFISLKNELGITGKALSQQSGVVDSAISQYINGKRDLPTETLWELLKGLESLSPGAIKLYLNMMLQSLGVSQDLAVQLVNIAMAVRDLETSYEKLASCQDSSDNFKKSVI